MSSSHGEWHRPPSTHSRFSSGSWGAGETVRVAAPLCPCLTAGMQSLRLCLGLKDVSDNSDSGKRSCREPGLIWGSLLRPAAAVTQGSEGYSEESGWAANLPAHLSISAVRVWLLRATSTLTGGGLNTCKGNSTQSPSVAQSKIIKSFFFWIFDHWNFLIYLKLPFCIQGTLRIKEIFHGPKLSLKASHSCHRFFSSFRVLHIF